MTLELGKRICGVLLAVSLVLFLIGCGVIIEEEEETEEIVETEENNEEMLAVINEKLTLLASSVKDPTDERQCVYAEPAAFDQILAYGEEAIPYLLTIGDRGAEYFETDKIAYLRCVLAYYAAYRIDPGLFRCELRSPDEKHTLDLKPATFLRIGDPEIGIIYHVKLLKNETGEVLVSTGRISSNAVLTWNTNCRYAIFCDRQHEWNTQSSVTVFDTYTSSFFLVNTPYMMEYYAQQQRRIASVMDLRFQHMDKGKLIFQFWMKAVDGAVITGQISVSSIDAILYSYTRQKNDFVGFLDSVSADESGRKHYWYTGDDVLIATRDDETGNVRLSVDRTIKDMIEEQMGG